MKISCFSRAHHFNINFVVNFANFQVVSMIGSAFVVDLSQPLSFAAVFHLLHVASFRSIAAGFSSTQPSTTPVIAAVPCRSAIRIFAFQISEAPSKLRAIATFKLLSSWTQISIPKWGVPPKCRFSVKFSFSSFFQTFRSETSVSYSYHQQSLILRHLKL